MKKFRKFIILLLLLLLLGVLVWGGYRWSKRNKKPAPPVSNTFSQPETPTHKTPKLHLSGYKVGDFGPDEERIAYQSESMTLHIPRINFHGPVYSTAMESIIKNGKSQNQSSEEIDNTLALEMDSLLEKGVVLFNQAQLPGVENRNVSIAGHRDFHGMEFYYIDTITDGDYIYLEYLDKQYVYQYKKTFITTEDDWSPIATTEKSQITLQSCDPIFAPYGKYDRIFVIAELVDVYDLTKEDGIVFETEKNK